MPLRGFGVSVAYKILRRLYTLITAPMLCINGGVNIIPGFTARCPQKLPRITLKINL
jgi:hypothetical protein